MTDARRESRARYARTATAYEAAWAPVLITLGRPLLEAVAPRPGERALDVGCGVGALARRLARAVGRRGAVVGVDLTPEMLALADPFRVSRACGDATRLPFAPASFDLAVCTFVLHHFPEQRAAFAEARRVLRRRGRLGVAVWGPDPPDPEAFALWDRLLDEHGAPPDPSPGRMWDDRLDSPAKLRRILERAGFARVRVWREARRYRWDAASFAAWRFAMGPWGRRLTAMPPAARRRFRAAARRALSRLDASAFLWEPVVVFAVARPS